MPARYGEFGAGSGATHLAREWWHGTGRVPAYHPHQRAHQDLPGDRLRRCGPSEPGCPHRRDLWPPRAERSRQDHDGGDAHHPGGPDLGPSSGGWGGRGTSSRVVQATERHRLPAEHPRSPANGVGELVLPRPAVRHGGRRFPPNGRRTSRALPAGEVGQSLCLRALGRDGPAPHGGPGYLPPAGGAVPGRAHRRARPQEPAGAVGDP